MENHDRLSSLILAHWTRYQPRMLAELRSQNKLRQTLEETAQRFADILYDLKVMRKMDYIQAWEMVIQEVLPEESFLSPNQKPDPAATSG